MTNLDQLALNSAVVSDPDPDFIPQADDHDGASSVGEEDELGSVGEDEVRVEPSVLGPGMLNAPIALTENSSQVYGHAPKDADSRYYRFADEAVRFTLGPMPVQDFLDTFLDCPGLSMDEMPSTLDAFKDVPMMGNTESDIYMPFVSCLIHRLFHNTYADLLRPYHCAALGCERGERRCSSVPGFHLQEHIDTPRQVWQRQCQA